MRAVAAPVTDRRELSSCAAALCDRLRTAGFAPTNAEVLIREITKVVLARKVRQ